MIVLMLPILVLAQDIGRTPPSESPELHKLDFFIGAWTAAGRSAPEKYGTRAGPIAGEARYRWTNRGRWLLGETTLAGPFDYGVSVMVAYDNAAAKYVAYAMTNFAPTAVKYSGAWVNDSTLVFEGALDPTARRTQRVTYERRSDGRIHFRVDESANGGATYKPDSDMMLERQK